MRINLMRYHHGMARQVQATRARAPKHRGPRTTLRLLEELARIAERRGKDEGISRNDVLVRFAQARAHKDWLLDLIKRAMVVLPLTAEAAEIAGELCAQQAFPPTGRRRRKGSRGQQHVAWIMDLFVGATVWVHGYDLVTRNLVTSKGLLNSFLPKMRTAAST